MYNISTQNNDIYSLPLVQKAKLKWSLHLLFAFLLIMFLSFILIPGDDQEKSTINILFLVFAILVGYSWLAITTFKKPHFILTDEYLEYRWLFGHKVIPLSSINKVDFVIEGATTKLGIWADEQGKRPLWETTDRFLGRTYSIGIVISTFRDIDFERLHLTIISKIKSQ